MTKRFYFSNNAKVEIFQDVVLEKADKPGYYWDKRIETLAIIEELKQQGFYFTYAVYV